MINKKVFSDTKNRLIKINILVVSSFLIIFSMFTFLYFRNITYNSIDRKLEEEYEYISMQINKTSYLNPIMLNDPRDLVYIYKGDRLIYYTKSEYFDNIVPQEVNNNNLFFTYKSGNYTFREFSLSIDNTRIRVIRNIDSELFSLKQLLSVISIGIAFSIVITYFIALYLTKKALKPVEDAWNTQAKFIQDASHELRTPITIVSSKLQSLLTVPQNTINDEIETIADAMNETRRLRKMIKDLLSLSKEDAVIKLNIEKINIKDILSELYRDYIDISEMQNKKLQLVINTKNNIIYSDKIKLRQLILIFLDNAFKYTKDNDSIKIGLEEKDNKIICFIEDSGIGISEKDLNHIFDRFFRSDNIRNQDIDGSGIGLSIAKMISINLNCKLIVKSKLNEGSRFEIIIPREINKK
ncbi:sensor histidine kinase [Terrisporobacter sp.]|uniref:sensor histidine kinase n=1 Tax=Terrisporobacter sp. TaxID=1965305 RepID=UPI0026393139|nr:HAMP domain-containing sensor histidine kinase [Terrisporobacter sp.]